MVSVLTLRDLDDDLRRCQLNKDSVAVGEMLGNRAIFDLAVGRVRFV